jgi:hypothetical protein
VRVVRFGYYLKEEQPDLSCVQTRKSAGEASLDELSALVTSALGVLRSCHHCNRRGQWQGAWPFQQRWA